MKDDKKMNNVDAFRFISFKMVPAIIWCMEALGLKVKEVKSQHETAGIQLRWKDGETITAAPTIYYPGSANIGVAQNKIMSGKNIMFINGDTIYVVMNESLLSVWSDKNICTIDTHKYSDVMGIGGQMMSRFDIEWAMANAAYKYAMTPEATVKYDLDIQQIL